MKAGTIIVEGKVGYLTGFMAHTGKIIAIGGADGACGDSLWGGEVWVAGPIKSLGVDTKLVEPKAEEVAEIEALLASRGYACLALAYFMARHRRRPSDGRCSCRPDSSPSAGGSTSRRQSM